MHNIQITPCLNGFITKIGCQTVVHTSVESLTQDLTSYLKDPKGTQDLFLKTRAINKEVTMGLGIPTPPPPCEPVDSVAQAVRAAVGVGQPG